MEKTLCNTAPQSLMTLDEKDLTKAGIFCRDAVKD